MKITAGTIVEVVTTNNGTGRGVPVLLTSDFDRRDMGYGAGCLVGDVVATYGGRLPLRISGDRLSVVTPVGRYREPVA